MIISGNVTINGEQQTPKKPFKKPALSIEDQISLLRKRWLEIDNEEKAKEYLMHISYYRLSGYLRVFYKDEEHNIVKWTSFTKVMDLYSFDRKLKIQLLDILERIEISFKTAMINCLSQEFWSHWFMDAKHFASDGASNNTFKIIEDELLKNKDNVFIKHYHEKYLSPKYPPSWMLFQLFSFGGLGNVYKSLSKTNKNKVAKMYGLNLYILESWIDCLSYLRNWCAHSDRVWNRRMTKKLSIKWFEKYFPVDQKWEHVIDKLYSYVLVIAYFLRKISPTSSCLWDFKKFIVQQVSLKKIDVSRMWFPVDWEKKIDEFLNAVCA